MHLFRRADLLTRPSCITTTRSASAIASVWSCVTMIVVMPPRAAGCGSRAPSPRAAWRRGWTAARRAAARAAGSPGRAPVRRAAAGRRKAGAESARRYASSFTSRSISATRACARGCAMRRISRPKRDVARDRQVREQRVALEHDAHPAPVRRQRGDAAAVQPDVAGAGGTKPAIMRSVVVLPQPDGPSSTISSPVRRPG